MTEDASTPAVSPSDAPDANGSKAMLALKIGTPIVLLIAAGMWFHSRNRVSTDDAQVGYEIQVAQAELDATTHEVEVADLAFSLSTEALTQARHRFEAGVSNNIEVINAQDELARANDNQISALYRLNQSRADLARATGQLEMFFTR